MANSKRLYSGNENILVQFPTAIVHTMKLQNTDFEKCTTMVDHKKTLTGTKSILISL